uniref:Late embryogenesis abundant protein LEA-2 subgroup domain-containing protein n=1 Tax=Aegilops tauschii TaxID=37682 RepID=R7W3F7_AEGTA
MEWTPRPGGERRGWWTPAGDRGGLAGRGGRNHISRQDRDPEMPARGDPSLDVNGGLGAGHDVRLHDSHPGTLNVTLLLTVSVHNPNPASFSFPSGGHTDLTYRGAHVGDAEIDPGRVPSKGVADLVADVEAGSLPLEASTRIPGRVAVFGVFKRHAVAYSDCSFVFGVAELGVRSQECRDHTKL